MIQTGIKERWYPRMKLRKLASLCFAAILATALAAPVFADDLVTRGEAFEALYGLERMNSSGGAAPVFADTSGKPYARAAAWARAAGISNGVGDDRFDGDRAITRAELVTALHRYAKAQGFDVSVGESTNILSYDDALSLPAWSTEAFQWACAAGILAPSGGDLAFADGVPSIELNQMLAAVTADQGAGAASLLYMGQASIRVTTAEGKVIYIDPFSGDDYDLPADLILVTHNHPDHNQIDKITHRNKDCRIITQDEAILDGVHQVFELGCVTVEAVEAGYNKNHDVNHCVGYVLTFSNGSSVYVTGDTSTTEQMPKLAKKEIDYAFFCCDGRFNMDLEEAAACARLVNAKHNIPYHMAPGAPGNFDREIAEQFEAENRIIMSPGDILRVI